MTEVISSFASAQGRRGVFVYYRKSPVAPRAVGTDRCAMVCQLPWGPLNEVTDFDDPATFRDNFAPEGFDRTGQGYLMATKFPWRDLKVIRVLGASPAKATYNIPKTGPTDVLTVPAKYYGAAGNGISVVIAAATDADANHFDMTVSKTNTSTGLATVEYYYNVDSTQTDANYWTNLTSGSKLLGGLTKITTGRPTNGTYTLASGSDGSAIASSDYLGTPGNGDKGVALLEHDPNVALFFTDDPGAGILAAVMAGVKAHAVLMNDRRVGLVMGLAGETKATCLTNVALNRGDHVAYAYPHCKVLDDAGTKQTIPLTGPLASLVASMSPHLSCAYKNEDFTKVLSSIVELDVAVTPGAKRELDAAGVVVFEQNSDGVFSPYSDGTTASDGTELYVTRMRDYIGFTLGNALDSYKNGPNVTEIIEDERSIIRGVLEALKRAQANPITEAMIVDFELLDVTETNTTASIQSGDIKHGFRAQLAAAQKRIFLIGEIGKTVEISVQSAA